LGHAQKCGRVKLGNGLSTLPFWLLDLQQKYRYIQMIKKICTDSHIYSPLEYDVGKGILTCPRICYMKWMWKTWEESEYIFF
jgi:hypothetical protein